MPSHSKPTLLVGNGTVIKTRTLVDAVRNCLGYEPLYYSAKDERDEVERFYCPAGALPAKPMNKHVVRKFR